jgi:hypothetical protein
MHISNLESITEGVQQVYAGTSSLKTTVKINNAPLRSGGVATIPIAIRFELFQDPENASSTFFPAGENTAAYLHRIWLIIDYNANCLAMMLYLPTPGSDVLPHAHVHRLMYTGDPHPMAPKACFRNAGALGDVAWGAMLVNLSVALAEAAGAAWMTVSDGSFVETCGGTRSVLLRKLQRIQYKNTFYEKHGFRYIEPRMLEGMGRVRTFVDAHAEYFRAQQAFIARLPICHRLPAAALCSDCITKPTDTVMTTGQALADNLRRNDMHACSTGWDSLHSDSCVWHPLVRHWLYTDPVAVRILSKAKQLLSNASKDNQPLQPLRAVAACNVKLQPRRRHSSRRREPVSLDNTYRCVATTCDGTRCRLPTTIINANTNARDIYCTMHGGGRIRP